MTAAPPATFTSSESAGWRARMRGERRHSPFSQRRYVRQWCYGWDAADDHLKRLEAAS